MSLSSVESETHAKIVLPGRRRPLIVACLVAGVATTILVGGYLLANHPWGDGDQPAAEKGVPRLPFIRLAKTVRPKKDSTLQVSVEQIATVEPYYRVDLKARASGWVKHVAKDIGSPVSKGELLVEIDVPESESEVAQKAAGIIQREKELNVSQARVKDAQAARDVAAAAVKQRVAELAASEATKDFRKRRFERFKELAHRGTAVVGVVDEEERDYLASAASVEAANAAIERAKADLAEAASKVEAALADIDLKRALIDVSRKDWDRANVVASYGRIVAPFDGVVVRRNVEPGSFVQNATTGASEPLMSIARNDLLTVGAKFPDNVAPFIRGNTAASIVIDTLPGFSLMGQISRFSPSIEGSDRTIRVEIDLFNGTAVEFEKVRAALDFKGPPGISPIPAGGNATKTSYRLVPGMTGTIQLLLDEGGNSFVLPSNAVYSRSGKPYILLVEDGKTQQVPVVVQVSDGKVVKLALMDRVAAGGHDVLRGLTGEEVVVVARQLEFGEGVKVESKLSEW